ncbi:MAG: UDP-N-acetylmuramate:L-alanyl-gamma-D-glutamyl-meso-diaminopimelate ligase [Thermodesulfobacteriota bacterium]|nr:UDP-N-acetylmuramate:L-alanyl-gamma-D-glutamyl-meso-diaminopimelate ligase [Thermodesulfobacteriota bacterium]
MKLPDPALNIIPENVKTVHLIAACGTAMAALACMLDEAGYRVTGSDKNVYPPMSDLLENRGIPMASGFSAENLSYAPDLVVVGNAVTRENPEVEKMIDMGLHYCSMPQAVNRFAAADKQILLVCGTHGKTTTSALLAWILSVAGLDPSFMIGGMVANFDSNFRTGSGPYMVIEGDEYDTAFFDKRSKFFHYQPAITILTSVEFDHADIFADLAAVKQAFREFLATLQKGTLLLAFDADDNVKELTADLACTVKRYGSTEKAHWRVDDVHIDPPVTRFAALENNRLFGRFAARLTGSHNLANMLAAIGAAVAAGVPEDHIRQALSTFNSVKRRQEIRGVVNNITVMDDFAHHPTAVRETISGIKPFYPDGRLIAVFEPRTNTSMRDVFQDAYAQAFDKADLICISEPPMPEKAPEGHRFSAAHLVEDLNRQHKSATCFPNADAIVKFLKSVAQPGDLILVMSNGGFDNIHEKLLAMLSPDAIC